MELAGIILIDKPVGMYSYSVVEKIKRKFKGVKVGHCGTLDPLCSGILPICIGKATKLSNLLMKTDKTYRTTILLGKRTDTFDIEGKILESKEIKGISPEQINEVINKFTGEIQQVPPYYSAKKFKGLPLYKYARKGNYIELPPSKVYIHYIKILNIQDDNVELEVKCSSGTYIRALANDIGKELGCGACCKNIRRIQWGNYLDTSSIPLETFLKEENRVKYIIAIEEIITNFFPTIEANDILKDMIIRKQNIPSQLLKTKIMDNSIRSDYLGILFKKDNLSAVLQKRGEFYYPIMLFL